MFRKLRTNRRPSPSTPLVKYLSEGREMEMALAPVAGTRLLASQSPHATGSLSRTTELREVSFRGYVGDVCGPCCRECCHRGCGAAHLRRASNEPASGGAMSKGERPQALGQSLQKSFATRWAPVGGTFVLGHALSPKNLSKNGSAPQKGVAFLTETFLKKKFQLRERIPLSAPAPARRAAAASEPKALPCPLTVRAHHGARPCWRKSIC